jgi:hypothetical protein
MISLLDYSNTKLNNGQSIGVGTKLYSDRALDSYWIVLSIEEKTNVIIIDEYIKDTNQLSIPSRKGILNAPWWYVAND